MNRRPRSDKKVYRVQAVERALDILDCFDFQNRKLSLTEICRRTGLNKSTALRLSSNLLYRKFLNLDSSTGLYSLGMRLFDLGSVVFASFSLRAASYRHITRLQQETSATTLVGVLIDQQLVYVDKREGDDCTVEIGLEIGWRRPPHFGMLGMVLISSLPEAVVETLLNEYPLEATTKATVTDPVIFRQRLAQVATDGYVAECGEAIDGVIGVAAPIIDYSRKVVAALGVGILAAQHDEKSVKRVIDRVRAAAASISSDLGYVES